MTLDNDSTKSEISTINSQYSARSSAAESVKDASVPRISLNEIAFSTTPSNAEMPLSPLSFDYVDMLDGSVENYDNVVFTDDGSFNKSFISSITG